MMRQSQIAEGSISKLRHSLAKGEDVSVAEIVHTMRELHRYVVMVEQKAEQAEIQANRRRFY